ncbi:retropepsin-like aspartic protease [Ulvibacter antarcticus]|uniref:Aspartyl protease n=1 Tax=Ulvibacter antarcticus TaxID=442714 RepID=A0A3L9ZHT2_9FLAO|nr:retropepsin-like aspartic protease [Ulvibacter antarcticus]RMA66272.1 aspartyl protease [Ulvibacter antarcticus]
MTQLRGFLEAKNYFRIPLRKLATGHYKLSAKVNGVKGDFILDTGASTSCIGFKSTTHFHLLSEESKIKAAGAGAIGMDTRISRNNKLSIDNWHVKGMDFVLFDLGHINEALMQTDEQTIHGIIGADFLKLRRGVIDYGRNCLYVK